MSDLISRQAAIHVICIECHDGICDEYPCGEIKALEALPPAQGDVLDMNVEDMVSRQAAIDAFDCTNELIVGGAANAQNVVNYINKVVGKIKALPSAQPMMTNAADLINRGDAILAVNKRIKQVGMENNADVLSIRQSIRDLSAAQPYTEEEIQAMQNLEQAQLDKAYELGWEEGREALRREIWEDGRDRLD